MKKPGYSAIALQPGFLAGITGFEPVISESKSGVLPLHYIPTSFCMLYRTPVPSGFHKSILIYSFE